MTPPSIAEQYLRKCRHFTGIPIRDDDSPTCKAGVEYASVRDTGVRPFRWPCTRPDSSVTCPHLSRFTKEEAEQKERETMAALNAALEKIGNGICHVCNAKVERERQVGSCIYAEPCGHRIGQGKAKP